MRHTLFATLLFAMPPLAAQAALPQAVGTTPLPSLAPMLENVTPAVVNIATEGHVELRMNPLFNDPFFRRFFDFPDQPRRRKTQSLGSGVIVDDAGYILTNNHVVENARAITVKLGGNETRPAEIVGLDDTTDLALLKIPAGGLIAAEWGDSDALQVGAPVWAVGNPFGLDRSVSFGIVSAKNRRVLSDTNPYQDFLQTDAAVNPGNSGGPLVDLGGKIVGINTAIVGHGHQGVSFSIPSSIAKDVYERLRANGRVVRGYMGVRLMEVTPEVAETLALKSTKGALVAQVESDAPAARAGIEIEDVIVKWDAQEVTNPTELTMLVGKAAIGSRVKVTVIRDGHPRELELEVDQRPPRIGR